MTAGRGHAGLELLRSQVEEGCIECGLCRKHCAFLKQYGLPGEIAARTGTREQNCTIAFECSLCGLCTAVCPQDIDPAAMFFAMRLAANRAGAGELQAHKGLLAYERWGTSPLFTGYALPAGCKTVFFPGCAVAGTRPGRVMEIFRFLREKEPSVGLVLDCCTKPSHDLARMDHFHERFGALRSALVQQGVRRVLVACPSCYRVWSDYGESVAVEMVYERLAGVGPIPAPATGQVVTVHDPCSTRQEAHIHGMVRALIASLGYRVEEMKHHGATTFCCGEGGAASHLVPAFAGNWTSARLVEAQGRTIVTYCAGCTGFLGSSAVHLADLCLEPESALQGKLRAARPPWTWVNRLMLKLRLPRLVRPELKGRRTWQGAVEFRQGRPR